MFAVWWHVRAPVWHQLGVVGARPDQTTGVVVVRDRDRAQPVTISRLQLAQQTQTFLARLSHEFFSIYLQWKWDHPVSAHYPVRTDNLLHLSPADLPHSRIVMSTGWCHFSNFLWGVLIPGRISPRGYLMNCQNPQQSTNKNLAIANKSRLSCAHNSSRASVITLWPWNLG